MAVALLFDLDDTLVVEEAAAAAAFRAAAQHAVGSYDVDGDVLAVGARRRARELWHQTPTYGYCLRVGISSWEGLWCGFRSDGVESRQLREWAPTYRREAWRIALADQGVDDVALAVDLGERFVEERRSRHETFPDAAEALTTLAPHYSLGLVTNGAACLQREKLQASGLADFFEAVVVSEDLGHAKPDPRPFREALASLGADRGLMVGDSVDKDVEGALSAGLQPIWLNRGSQPAPRELAVRQVSTLRDLPLLVAELV